MKSGAALPRQALRLETPPLGTPKKASQRVGSDLEIPVGGFAVAIIVFVPIAIAVSSFWLSDAARA